MRGLTVYRLMKPSGSLPQKSERELCDDGTPFQLRRTHAGWFWYAGRIDTPLELFISVHTASLRGQLTSRDADVPAIHPNQLRLESGADQTKISRQSSHVALMNAGRGTWPGRPHERGAHRYNVVFADDRFLSSGLTNAAITACGCTA